MNTAQRILTLATVSLQSVLSRVRGRPALLPPAAIQSRLDICSTCPALGRDGKCSVCGCACNGRQEWFNKLAHEASGCPVGKW